MQYNQLLETVMGKSYFSVTGELIVKISERHWPYFWK